MKRFVYVFLMAMSACSIVDDGDLDALVSALEAMRTSKRPEDRETWSVMNMWAREKTFTEKLAAKGKKTKIATVVCVTSPAANDEGEWGKDEMTSPSLPAIKIPTEMTVAQALECMKSQGGDPLLAYGACVLKIMGRAANEWQAALVDSGSEDAECRYVFMPGFQPLDIDLGSETDSERIANRLIGADAPPVGVPIKWLTTNVVQPFPGCGWCESPRAPGGEK